MIRHRRWLFFIATALLLLTAASCTRMQRQARQRHLNAKLIAAIEDTNPAGVHAMLSQGADANACDTRYVSSQSPPDTIIERLRRMLRMQPPGEKIERPSLYVALDRVTDNRRVVYLDNPYNESADLEIIRALIAGGANVRAKTDPDVSLLGVSLDEGVCCNGITRLLIKHGADVNGKDMQQYPLICIAADTDNLDAIEMLANAGANVDAVDKFGQTALGSFSVSGVGDPECVRLLLKHGANVDAQDEDGNTPLMNAVDSGQLEILRLLLIKGSNVNLRNHKGDTALSLALSRKPFQPEAVRLLRSKEVKP